MRESALEVVSRPARMNVLDETRQTHDACRLQCSTYDICASISSSVIFSLSAAAMFALTR